MSLLQFTVDSEDEIEEEVSEEEELEGEESTILKSNFYFEDGEVNLKIY
jgi:hypothetical protein